MTSKRSCMTLTSMRSTLPLPNALHHEAVLAAARGKKHVLCEKPFAMTVAHACEMVAACHDAGVILRIGHQLRLDVAIGRAREIVAPVGSDGSRRSPSSVPRAWDRGHHGARTPHKAASFSMSGCTCSTLFNG